MKKIIFCLSTIVAMAFGGSAVAQQYEEFYGKKFEVGCDRIVFETHLDKDGGRVDYYYNIQRNCLKVPIFSVKEKTEEIQISYKGYKIEITKFNRDKNNINDVMLFKIRKAGGELVENTLYEASDVTGRICTKLMDLVGLKGDKLGCDGTYDFKSLGLPPSKKNPMQREVGQDIEELCDYLLEHKAKKIIDGDLKLHQKHKEK
jgi:hypothetical protein